MVEWLDSRRVGVSPRGSRSLGLAPQNRGAVVYCPTLGMVHIAHPREMGAGPPSPGDGDRPDDTRRDADGIVRNLRVPGTTKGRIAAWLWRQRGIPAATAAALGSAVGGDVDIDDVMSELIGDGP